MKPSLKKLHDQVIVITGATSGIGLATAKMAAERGAKLVLGARNEESLKKTCEDIRQDGGEAIYSVCDVASDEAVQKLAQAAIDRFGGFDTWINNSGISIYGKLTETRMREKRRLFDVNFWGVVHGCKAAVPVLRERGGAIINIGSVLSERVIPIQGIYCASKHAVKAYTDALRMELEAEGAPISVSLVKPSAIDTPYTEHAKNHLDGEPVHTAPVYSPDVVARTILACAETPIRDIFVGGSGKLYSMMEKFIPRITDLIMERSMMETGQTRKDVGKKKKRPDSLFRTPKQEGRSRGTYPGHVMRSSAYTTFALHPMSSLLVGSAMALVLRALTRGLSLGSQGFVQKREITDSTERPRLRRVA